MSDVTEILSRLEIGDSAAAEQLFEIVYDQLRRMARSQMTNERAEHTLQPTALVHEAYLRLVGGDAVHWDGRGHFFASAAEAMRRILVDHARAKNAAKRGGGHGQIELDVEGLQVASLTDGIVDVLMLDEALNKLAAEAPDKAQLVKLRYFAGLSLEESAQAMGISEATAKRYWVFARAWLFRELEHSNKD
jgi:RNA polymerase sigma factor (TIGR02999 family)